MKIVDKAMIGNQEFDRHCERCGKIGGFCITCKKPLCVDCHLYI